VELGVRVLEFLRVESVVFDEFAEENAARAFVGRKVAGKGHEALEEENIEAESHGKGRAGNLATRDNYQ
jgi:hypothetical protein